MCGRYALRKPKSELAREFEIAEENLPVLRFGRYNIAPTQQVLGLLLTAEGKQQLVPLRWGLIPAWANDEKIASKLINARCETLGEKPAFRGALKSRRCVVLADGFYEWKAAGGKKQPYFFHLHDHRLFGFAALYERWKKPDGEEVMTCAIVTSEANGIVKPVHERMPVVLKREQWEAWLDPSRFDFSDLLLPFAEAELESRAADPLVNSPANDGPECIDGTADRTVA